MRWSRDKRSGLNTRGLFVLLQTVLGRRVDQIASFSVANADPPFAANKIKRHVVKITQTMVGHKLAEARFHPPYDYGRT